jgi:hypothetical protein
VAAAEWEDLAAVEWERGVFGLPLYVFSTEAWISTSSFSTSSFSMPSFSASSFSTSSFSTSSPFCPPAKISYLTVGYFVRRVWSLNGGCCGYSQTDSYGQKIERATSVPRREQQQAHGNYWLP